MKNITRVGAALAAAFATACRPGSDSTTTHQWSVDLIPAPAIGVETGSPEEELDRAYSARRMSDGRIAVANTGSHEVRFFGRDGAFLYSVGREGAGPGEFSGVMKLLAGPGDSVLVLDMGTDRLTTLAGDGSLGWSTVFQADSITGHGAWIYRATLLFDGGHRAEVADVLDRLPDPNAPGMGRLDDTGALWRRVLTDPGNQWSVYRLDGAILGSVTLPRFFELLQAGADFVLGRERDSLGVERVVQYALLRAPSSAGSLQPNPGPATFAQEEAKALRQAVVRLMGAQEMYYANHASYAATADSLPWSGAGTPLIIGGDSRGWLAMVIGEGGSCAAAVGYLTPPFWSQGSAVCAAVGNEP